MDLIAELWRSAEADIHRDRTLLAGQRADGETTHFLLRSFARGSPVDAPTVRTTAELARRTDVGGVVAVSSVGFRGPATAIADALGVGLVGPGALARCVEDSVDVRSASPGA